jgi:hypothetical protein
VVWWTVKGKSVKFVDEVSKALLHSPSLLVIQMMMITSKQTPPDAGASHLYIPSQNL